jgi:hypothetical protein
MTLSRAQSSTKFTQGLVAAIHVQCLQAISDQTRMPTPVRGIRSPTPIVYLGSELPLNADNLIRDTRSKRRAVGPRGGIEPENGETAAGSGRATMKRCRASRWSQEQLEGLCRPVAGHREELPEDLNDLSTGRLRDRHASVTFN